MGKEYKKLNVMQWYDRIRQVKFLLVVMAIVIAVGSLIISNYLVRDLALGEHQNMEVWAEAMRTLNNADENTDVTLVLKVLNGNNTIPVIVQYKSGEIHSYRNLSLKASNAADSTREVKQMAEDMRQGGRVIRIYLNEGKLNMMRKAFTQPGEAMESKLLAKVIASAQAKVEAFHFDGRKNLLEYDDVANDQRHAIYEQRNYLLDNDDISETIKAIRRDVFNDVIDQYIPPQSLEEQWDIKGLEERLAQEFGLELPIEHWLEENNNLHEENLRERIIQEAEDEYKAKEALAGEETMRHFEKGVMLQTLDELWKEHLAAMDYLRQGIHLRGYAQKDPKQEYKKESFRMFTEMLDSLKHHVITTLTRVKVRTQEEMEEAERARQTMAEREAQTHHPVGENTEQAQSEDYSDRHIGRNEPCPCGSGKKYKHCHGNKARYA